MSWSVHSAESSLSSQSSSSDLERAPKRLKKNDSQPLKVFQKTVHTDAKDLEIHKLKAPVRKFEQTSVIDLVNTYEPQLLEAFLEEVKNLSTTLDVTLKCLLSKNSYSVFLNMPWEEITDSQKNYFFTKLFQVLDRSSREILNRLLQKKECLPAEISKQVFEGLINLLPNLIKEYTLITIENVPSRTFLFPSQITTHLIKNRSLDLYSQKISIKLPNYLLLIIEKLPLFIKSLSEEIKQNLLNTYYIYLFSRHFKSQEMIDICKSIFKQKKIISRLPYLNSSIGELALESNDFDFFYPVSGPLRYDPKRKDAILSSYPTLVENYIFLTFRKTDQEELFSFLISKKDLETLPFFKALINSSLKGGQSKADEFFFEAIADHREYWRFFSFHFEKDMDPLSMTDYLTILRLGDFYCCDKAIQASEDVVIEYISSELKMKQNMLILLVQHMQYSNRLKIELEKIVWKVLFNSHNSDELLHELSPYINSFDCMNFHDINSNRLLQIVSHFSNTLETLNLTAASLNEAQFEKISKFVRLKNLKLDKFSHLANVAHILKSLPSLTSVELIDESEKLSHWDFPTLPWENLTISSPIYPRALIKALPQLKSLSLNLSESQVKTFIQDFDSLNNLLYLNIDPENDFDLSHILKICSRLRNLQSLSFAKNRMIHQISLQPFTMEPNFTLRELYFPFQAEHNLISFFPNLKILHLAIDSQRIMDFIPKFKELSALESLSITAIDSQIPLEKTTQEYKEYQLYGDSQFEPIIYSDFFPFDFSCLKNLRSLTFNSIPARAKLANETYMTLSKMDSLEHISLMDQDFSQGMLLLLKKPNLKSLKLQKIYGDKSELLKEMIAYAYEHQIKLIFGY